MACRSAAAVFALSWTWGAAAAGEATDTRHLGTPSFKIYRQRADKSGRAVAWIRSAAEHREAAWVHSATHRGEVAWIKSAGDRGEVAWIKSAGSHGEVAWIKSADTATPVWVYAEEKMCQGPYMHTQSYVNMGLDTVQECAKKCRELEGCEFFTYDPVDVYCYFHAESVGCEMVEPRNPGTQIFRFYRSLAENSHEAVAWINPAGHPGELAWAKSAGDHGELYIKSAGDHGEVAWIKSAGDHGEVAWVKSTDTATPASGSGTPIFRIYKQLADKSGRAVAWIRSAAEHREVAWVHSATHRGEAAWIKSAGDRGEVAWIKSAGNHGEVAWIKSADTATPVWVYAEEKMCQGPYMHTQSYVNMGLDTVQECAKKCRELEGCEFFTYDPVDVYCYFHAESVGCEMVEPRNPGTQIFRFYRSLAENSHEAVAWINPAGHPGELAWAKSAGDHGELYIKSAGDHGEVAWIKSAASHGEVAWIKSEGEATEAAMPVLSAPRAQGASPALRGAVHEVLP